uniref:Uncharacterized protein n=2 Tax=Amphimedon queenslandica TaxID=400682 RepID=A0A1X7SKW6_AMPQE
TVEEYNPMRLHYIAARAQTLCLHDPLLSQQRDHLNELTVMHNCDVGAPSDGSRNIQTTVSSGRTSTDPVQWLAMKLIQINSEDRHRSRQKVKDYQSATHFLDATTLIRETDDASDEPQVPHKTPIKYIRGEEINLQWS